MDDTGAGRVQIVGAGPGDPGLLTLRGVECLQRADVILYDYLVNPQVWQPFASPDAEIIALGKSERSDEWPPTAIQEKMVRAALEGKTVVRLKGGDPCVFARLSAELDVLRRHQIDFEIVPGITVGLAVGSYLELALTDRQLASAVALVTAREDADKEEPALDYGALAQFPGTLVFYMGVGQSRAWTAALMGAGKPAETPAMLVRRCTLPEQARVHCRLDEVAHHLAPESGFAPPVIVVVGAVAQRAPDRSWFERRPLFGQTVLVTRPATASDPLIRALARMGAEVLSQPVIAIEPLTDWSAVDDAIGRLHQFDWLVWSSAHGVRSFLDRLAALGLDARALGALRLAAIGPGTAQAASEYRLRVDLQPGRYRAEDLADALAKEGAGRRFLLARASRGREVLAERLQDAGGTVEQLVVYKSIDILSPQADVAQRMEQEEVHWVSVTSSAIARSLHRMFGPDLKRCRLASISPVTSQTLRQLGLTPAVEADPYTMEGLVAAIVRSVGGHGPDEPPAVYDS